MPWNGREKVDKKIPGNEGQKHIILLQDEDDLDHTAEVAMQTMVHIGSADENSIDRGAGLHCVEVLLSLMSSVDPSHLLPATIHHLSKADNSAEVEVVSVAIVEAVVIMAVEDAVAVANLASEVDHGAQLAGLTINLIIPIPMTGTVPSLTLQTIALHLRRG